MALRYGPSASASRPERTPAVNPLTVTINGPTGVQRGDSFDLTVTWSREVTSSFMGGTARCFTVSQGISDATVTFASTDNVTFTVTVTPTADTEGVCTYLIRAHDGTAADDGTTGPIQQVTHTTRYNVRRPRIEWALLPGQIFFADATVLGTWNQAVDNFEQTDLDIRWLDQSNRTGTITLSHMDGSSDASLDVEFPVNSQGAAVVTVNQRTVESTALATRDGPPVDQTVYIQYDTDTPGVVIDTTPPTLEISEPALTPWANREITLEFLWSERVVGFTEADITVPAGVTVAPPVSIEFNNVNNRLFEVTFTFPQSFNADATISVAPMTVTDVAGNANDTGDSVTFAVDTREKTPTFTDRNNNAATEICAVTHGLADNPFIQNAMGTALGGYFAGVMEVEKNGNDMYAVVQILRKREGKNEPTFVNAAGALVHIDLTTNTCTVLERYDHIQLAPRSLVVHDGAVHMFYCSHYVYINIPSSPDYRESLGFIRRINPTTQAIEYVARPYRYRARLNNNEDINVGWGGGTTAPMLSVGNELHMFANYDNALFVHDNSRDASRYDNFNWLVLRQKLNRRLPRFDTNQRIGWDVLKELAFLSNSIIGFDEDGFFMRPRDAVNALTVSDIPATGGVPVIEFRLRNRDFPSGAGMFVVDNEVFSYTDVNNTGTNLTFTGVERAQAGTEEAFHMASSRIYHISHTLKLDDSVLFKPIHDANISLNTRQYYNMIRLRYAINDPDGFDPVVSERRNTQSISNHGERIFERDIPLSRHQSDFADFLSRRLLTRFSDIQYNITLQLKPTLFAKIGDYVYINVPEKAHITRVCQITGITHHLDQRDQSTTWELVTI